MVGIMSKSSYIRKSIHCDSLLRWCNYQGESGDVAEFVEGRKKRVGLLYLRTTLKTRNTIKANFVFLLIDWQNLIYMKINCQ